MEFDNFDDVEDFHARYDHENGTWIFDTGVADDIIADWAHERPARKHLEIDDKGYVLVDLGPDGVPVTGHWPRHVTGSDSWYRLDQFPFQRSVEVTTDPPPAPRVVNEPTQEQYAEFGRWMAVVFATSDDWNGDTIADVGQFGHEKLGVRIDNEGMDEGEWDMWDRVANRYGYEMPEQED